MIVGMNHKDRRLTEKINTLVGKPFSFIERIKQGGIGSGRMEVSKMSEKLHPCFDRFQDTKTISIELRPKGVIVYIKNKVNDYAWVIPYYQLSIYQSDYVSIHGNGQFLKLPFKAVYPKHKPFIHKILAEKNRNVCGHPLDF